MRLFNLSHPDQVDDLPWEFTQWALAFAATEAEAQAEAEQEAADRVEG